MARVSCLSRASSVCRLRLRSSLSHSCRLARSETSCPRASSKEPGSTAGPPAAASAVAAAAAASSAPRPLGSAAWACSALTCCWSAADMASLCSSMRRRCACCSCNSPLAADIGCSPACAVAVSALACAAACSA
eukprot:scaffold54249_cov50-Phaeocystis_antarctica.AAC.2